MIKTIAIIGYGNIAKKHVEVFNALGATVVASANRSEAKRAEAQKDGIKHVYADYHEMIKQHRPDGILVCVSFWNMFEVLSQVIPYGIPILAEKPTGTSLAEHLALCELAEKHATPVMVGLNRRHYSVIQKAIEDIGGKQNITNVLIEWSEDPKHLKNNRNLTPDQISKQIFGNTIHGLDILIHLIGPINHPNITTQKHPGEFRWLMNINGKTENGVLYNFNSSWDNPVPWRIVLYAENKRYVFAPLETCEKTEGREKTSIAPDDVDLKFKAGFLKQAKAFLANSFIEHDLHSVTNSMNLAEHLSTHV